MVSIVATTEGSAEVKGFNSSRHSELIPRINGGRGGATSVSSGVSRIRFSGLHIQFCREI